MQGIGPVLANRILEARNAIGGVLSAHQLAGIPGIGPARLEAIIDAGGSRVTSTPATSPGPAPALASVGA